MLIKTTPLKLLATLDSKISRKTDLLMLAGATLTLVCMSLILIWGTPKGISLTDEGFALLASIAPQESVFHSSFGYFLHLLPHLNANQILNLRIWNLITRFVSSVALTAAVINLCKIHGKKISWPSRFVMFEVTAIGSLMTFCVHPQTLSYNGLTYFFLSVLAACTIFSVSSKSKINAALWAFFAGTFGSFGIFVKFTSALLAFVASLIVSVILRPNSLRSNSSASLLGVLTGLAIFHAFLQPLNLWWLGFVSFLSADLDAAHSPVNVFRDTSTSLVKHSLELAVCVLFLAILLLWFRRTSLNSTKALQIINSACLNCLVVFCVYFFASLGHLHRALLYFPLLPISFIGLLAFKKKTVVANSLESAVTIIYLLIMPAIFSFGTDTPLPWHMICNLGPLYLGCLVTMLYAQSVLGCRKTVTLWLSVLCMLSLYELIFGYVLEPQDTNPLFEQQFAVKGLPNMVGIQLEPPLRNYLQDSADILKSNGYRTGDLILQLYDGAGLVYAMGAKSPGGLWYDPLEPSINRFYLTRLSNDAYIPFIIIANADESPLPNSEMLSNLSGKGIKFKRDYQLIGKALLPYLHYKETLPTFIYKHN